MDTSRETTGEFWRRVYTVIVMWFFGSTLAGWFIGASWGHGGVVLVIAAWLLGACGLLVHLLVLFRRRRQRAA
jgi:hypothetical protein